TEVPAGLRWCGSARSAPHHRRPAGTSVRPLQSHRERKRNSIQGTRKRNIKNMSKDITANIGELIQKSVDQPSIQDLIAPSAIKITPNFIQIGTRLARTLFVFMYPRYLNTG